MSEEDVSYSDYSNRMGNDFKDHYSEVVSCPEGEDYDEKLILNEMLIQEASSTYENLNEKSYLSTAPGFSTSNDKNSGYECENDYKLVELGRIESGFCGFGLFPSQPVCTSYLQHPYALRQNDFYQQDCGYYPIPTQGGWQADDSSRCSLYNNRTPKLISSEDSSVTPSSSTGRILSKSELVYKHYA